MPPDATSPATPSTPGSGEETSPQADQVQAALEKRLGRVKASTDLWSALQSPLASLTSSANAPQGVVTLDGKGGALAPWLTQRVLGRAAQQIAEEAHDAVQPDGSRVSPVRILLTDDPQLLRGDILSRVIRETLTDRLAEVGATAQLVTDTTGQLTDAKATFDAEPSDDRLAAAEPDTSLRATDEPEGEEGATTGAEADADGTSAPLSLLDTAVDLVRLTAVDYDVTSQEVPVAGSLLALLTAAELRKLTKATDGVGSSVVLDGLEVRPQESDTFQRVRSLTGAIHALGQTAMGLRKTLAPVTAQMSRDQERVDTLTKKVAEKDVPPATLSQFQVELQAAAARLRVREGPAAEARAVLDRADAVIAAARADLTLLTASDTGGVTPLERACSREGLHGSPGRITHVLYVAPTRAGAEQVTRQSVMGASGRLAHLGTVNAVWVVVAAAHGGVVGGGAANTAEQAIQDLTTGRVTLDAEDPHAVGFNLKAAADPTATYEARIRTGVYVVAASLAVLALVFALTLFVVLITSL